MIICKYCNTQLTEGLKFCIQCGAEVSDQKGKKSRRKRPFILFTAGVLVLIVVLTSIIPKVISNITKKPLGVVYIKKGEIKYSSLFKIKPKEIEDEFTEDNSIFEGNYGNFSFSEDGKRMFYPENINNPEIITDTETGNTIYYSDLTSKDPKGIKIDSDITTYKINKSGTKIFYKKGSDNILYVNNLSDRDRIDSNVAQYYLDETGNKLIYTTEESIIYAKDGNKKSEKVAENARIRYFSSDFESIYYIKNNVLFLKSWDGDEEKIASDVSEVVNIYDTGEIYYLQMKTEESTSFSGLNNNAFSPSSLYYYTEGKTKLITDSYAYLMNYSNDKPVLIYATYVQTPIPGLGEAYFSEDVSAGTSNIIDDICVVIGGKTSKLDADDTIKCMINSTGNTIYYYRNNNEQKRYGDLYYVTIEGTSISESKLYEKDINGFDLTSSGNVIYYKNAVDYIGDLYLDKKRIDSKVDMSHAFIHSKLGPFVYCTDYDQTGSNYTLKLYNGKKSVVIAENVTTFEQIGKEQIVYITDYKAKSLTGDLYLYNGSYKNQLIDEDVSQIIFDFNNYNIWGRNMYGLQ